jgi:hypothetical protein
MKIFITLYFIFLTSIAFASQSGDSRSFPSPLWTVSNNLSAPESVYFEPDSKLVFISNIAGEGNQKDGKGWIQLLKPSGEIIDPLWIENLNAPKGMRAKNGFLWVTDIDQVIAINIKEKKITKKISIPKAIFLNDIAISDSGTVYVSDTIGRTIYEINNDSVSIFLSGDQTESPNGLLIKNQKLFVAAWGLAAPDWSTTTLGNLYSIDLKTKKKNIVTKAPLGNLDGLELKDDNTFITSDWMAGKLYTITLNGEVTHLSFEKKMGTADIGYIPEDQTLIIPYMKDHVVKAFHLKN